MQVYLSKDSPNEDWEIKINFNNEGDEDDIISILDIISMAATNPSLYEKTCHLIAERYGEGVLTGLMGKSANVDEFDQDDPEQSSFTLPIHNDTNPNSEEALHFLAEIPLVGNINIQA